MHCVITQIQNRDQTCDLTPDTGCIILCNVLPHFVLCMSDCIMTNVAVVTHRSDVAAASSTGTMVQSVRYSVCNKYIYTQVTGGPFIYPEQAEKLSDKVPQLNVHLFTITDVCALWFWNLVLRFSSRVQHERIKLMTGNKGITALQLLVGGLNPLFIYSAFLPALSPVSLLFCTEVRGRWPGWMMSFRSTGHS